MEGISTNRVCETSANCLAAAGKQFVIRYYSRTTKQPEKQLRPKEAAELARAGIQLAVVYQDRAREEEDFNYQRGLLDGASAFASAGQIGQPADSAIYFAVDTDFSTSQLQTYVKPYFEGVRDALQAASEGTPFFKMGVYGSGLTCRLLKQWALVEFAWLAEATGWRESSTYTAWHIKQFVTNQTLCNIENGWQRCTTQAPHNFGAFQPTGFDVTQGEGVWMQVKATALNLRFAPTATNNTPITKLPYGTRMRLLGTSGPGWARVRVVLDGATFIGHVKSEHLEPAAADTPVLAALPAIPAVHWKENNPASKRSSPNSLASPLGEAGQPKGNLAASAAVRVQQLGQIGDWLDVEASARYQPRALPTNPNSVVTFCNVYAADYCYLASIYLPRVWWTADAISRLAAGQVVAPAYDQTIREMRADDLYRWLLDFGPSFGWRRVSDATALRKAANAGGIGLICADRLEQGRPGHITVVVPEAAGQSAQYDAAGNVDQPLQSQAGAVNRRYGSAGQHWWRSDKFTGYVFFVHD